MCVFFEYDAVIFRSNATLATKLNIHRVHFLHHQEVLYEKNIQNILLSYYYFRDYKIPLCFRRKALKNISDREKRWEKKILNFNFTNFKFMRKHLEAKCIQIVVICFEIGSS